MTETELDESIEARLHQLTQGISALRDTKVATMSPQAQYLLQMDNIGALRRIRYEHAIEPERMPGDAAAFSFSIDQGAIHFSRSFKASWIGLGDHLNLDRDAIHDLIDVFLLHEIFHVGQGLTTERHSDIRNAPAVLRAVDYYADASAAISAMILRIEADGLPASGWKGIYSRVLLAVIRQIYLFDFASDVRQMPVARFLRHFTWHYQFHRVTAFRDHDPFLRHQLMLEPAFSFRGFNSDLATNGLVRTWPTDEPDALARDAPHLWFTAPNAVGIPGVRRFLSTKRQNYQSLFDGIFSGTETLSAPFLLEIFNQFDDLVGGWSVSPDAATDYLLQELRAAAWIDTLTDEGDHRLDLRPALRVILSHGHFDEFLRDSGLYFGWNKNYIDRNRARLAGEYESLQTRILETHRRSLLNYPPR